MSRERDTKYLQKLLRMKEEGKFKPETPTSGLPLIDEITTNTLMNMYHLNDKKLPSYLPSYYDEEEEENTPLDLGLDIATDLLNGFPRNDRNGYLTHLYQWLDDSFVDAYSFTKPTLEDCALAGVGFVLKAFEVQFGTDVVDNLQNVNPVKMRKAFEENEPPDSRISRISRIFKGRNIPIDQLFLGKAIGEYAAKVTNPTALTEGAKLQYFVTESLWGELKIQEPSK